MAKQFGVECAVSWCVCLTKPESQYCAVHAKRGKDYRTMEAPDGDASIECDACDGTGECADCDGDGTHECGHTGCMDEHDCGCCDGSGDCQECTMGSYSAKQTAWEAEYLAFAFDPGWVPPVLISYPWETA